MVFLQFKRVSIGSFSSVSSRSSVGSEAHGLSGDFSSRVPVLNRESLVQDAFKRFYFQPESRDRVLLEFAQQPCLYPEYRFLEAVKSGSPLKDSFPRESRYAVKLVQIALADMIDGYRKPDLPFLREVFFAAQFENKLHGRISEALSVALLSGEKELGKDVLNKSVDLASDAFIWCSWLGEGVCALLDSVEKLYGDLDRCQEVAFEKLVRLGESVQFFVRNFGNQIEGFSQHDKVQLEQNIRAQCSDAAFFVPVPVLDKGVSCWDGAPYPDEKNISTGGASRTSSGCSGISGDSEEMNGVYDRVFAMTP